MLGCDNPTWLCVVAHNDDCVCFIQVNWQTGVRSRRIHLVRGIKATGQVVSGPPLRPVLTPGCGRPTWGWTGPPPIWALSRASQTVRTVGNTASAWYPILDHWTARSGRTWIARQYCARCVNWTCNRASCLRSYLLIATFRTCIHSSSLSLRRW